MPSSTSSSDRRYLVAFVSTFLVLAVAWEAVLRVYAGATARFALDRPKMETVSAKGETWVLFGNCLVMTGISPKLLAAELGPGDRTIVNIATHEQSPIAFFDYLDRTNRYPDVVIANVSSWINGTNFEQEGDLVFQDDPLGVVPAQREAPGGHTQSYREGSVTTGKRQQQIEDAIAEVLSDRIQMIGHRYHLFDYSIFLGTLATTADLDSSLFQLNIQSWFKVTRSETDGLGYLGVHVDYRPNWPRGLDVMAERYLKRMRLSHLLTDRYWSLLEGYVQKFEAKGTRVLFVRMPEHPSIRAFNDDEYDIATRLDGIAQRTGIRWLDLSTLGPDDGVHLFDSVHADAAATEVLTRKVAAWARDGNSPLRESTELPRGR